MRTVFFSISKGRIIISMPDEKSIKKLLKGLRDVGIEVDEELRSLCG